MSKFRRKETVQSALSNEKGDSFRDVSARIFAVCRWLFILGLTGFTLRIIGLGGESAIAGVIGALKVGDFVYNDLRHLDRRGIDH